jgi:hypothetical protein
MHVGLRTSRQGRLPHLRRWASCPAVYPALPRWANVFRASGAASRLTNQKLPTTSCRLQVASYHLQIPNRPRHRKSAGGAPECSPAREDWE